MYKAADMKQSCLIAFHNLVHAQCAFQIATGMPSIPIYLRKANYEKLRRRAEATGKSIGKIINELIQQMN